MCGIVGSVGSQPTVQMTLKRLAQLEYRGYDSYGIASIHDSIIDVVKQVGSIGQAASEGRFASLPEANVALAHTRWATHGGVTQENAHPHLSYDGRIALVHNGVIENYAELRSQLAANGIAFASETDTEIMAHLIALHISEGKPVVEAIAAMCQSVTGEYAIGVIHLDEPEYLYGAKRKSPLLLCQGDDESVLASDRTALVGMNSSVTYLDDGDIVRLGINSVALFHLEANGELHAKEPTRVHLEQTINVIDRGDFDHFMIKEINEIPQAARQALTVPSDVLAKGLPVDGRSRVTMIGSGSAYYVGYAGSYLFSEYANLSVPAFSSDEAEYLTRFNSDDTVIAISQSGETFDTLEVCRHAIAKGATLTSISNAPESTQERMATHRIQQNCGVEVCVLSTKSIVNQLLIVGRMAVEAGKRNGTLSNDTFETLHDSLERLPSTLQTVINDYSPALRLLAEKYCESEHWFFVGRGVLYPVALESALKFKEVSYHHAEGMAAGFFKHGTISLIEDDFYTVALFPSRSSDRERYLATLANISEIAARGGPVIAFGPEDMPSFDRQNCVEYVGLPYHHNNLADVTIQLVAGQIFAYYCALTLGREIDQPRSLAKSVTVR